MSNIAHTPIYIQHDLPVSESIWKNTSAPARKHSHRPDQKTKHHVEMQELSRGLCLLRSELNFDKETELREEYPESEVFQLSFCLSGSMEWDFETGQGGHYEISPTECSLQCGRFSRCSSYYGPGEAYRTLGIVMERTRFTELTQQLEVAHLICPEQKICSRVFPTTSEIRLVLQQLMDCPPERKLKKLYLEGKALELLALFCEEVTEKQNGSRELSREDCRCLLSAREFIDKKFLHPLTLSQIAQQCFLSETKLKQGFKICFNCTVYEYIVEKRMEMAYRLLQSRKYKVKDVVWMVGYSNTSHFIEAFKKRYGVTPGEI